MRSSSPARLATLALLVSAPLFARSARAGDALVLAAPPTLDPPTLTALGVQISAGGDDNHNAVVTLRYRPSGAAAWKEGLPLFRVHPEVVTGYAVADQLAGSVFDLAPATAYEIEIHATDPDGAVDTTMTLTGTTRPVPAAEPKTAAPKTVTDTASLKAALAAAKPGDVITLKKGVYAGTFALDASGTSSDPIVIRGEAEEDTILDGMGDGGNVLEIYGSFVHVERLTIKNANRAIRFQGAGAEGNVVRRVHIVATKLGIGSKPDQKDFYLCDNTLEGLLAWPAVYSDDGGAHANDDGIHVEGTGHVVCHNTIRGYGDAMKTEQSGARSLDFYGNDVLSAYDNGLELDGSSGNVRALRNRFTNTYATMSFQPIFGGPVYAIRNVIVNVTNEQLKLHALGTMPPQEPSGIFILHNTFVSSGHAVSLSTSATTHYFVLENNLFIGPAAPDQGKTVSWDGPIDHGTLDFNGYYPEGKFTFNFAGTGYQNLPDFAAVQAIGLEAHGLVVDGMSFASGLVAPPDSKGTLAAQDVTLAAGSPAVDRGLVMPGVNDGFQGNAPDLGALELGCAAPIYGVRAEGADESNEVVGCSSSGGTSTSTTGASAGGGSSMGTGVPTGAGGSGGAAASSGPGDAGGCGCRAAGGAPMSPFAALAIAAALAASRRRKAAVERRRA